LNVLRLLFGPKFFPTEQLLHFSAPLD